MKSMQHPRRTFLRNVLVAGGSLAAFGTGAGIVHQLARAAGPNERFYVFAYFSGGWDVLLGLDPRDPARFNSETAPDTRIEPGYELIAEIVEPLVRPTAELTLGPFIGDLANHADRLAVVRGMSMETLTHEVGRRRFLTGKPPSGLQARGSSGATWLASHFGVDDPIPNLSIRVEQYNIDQPNYASALRVGNATDMLDLLRPADPALDEASAAAVAELLHDESECDRARHSAMLRAAKSGKERVTSLIEGNYASLFDFRAMTPEMEAIRARYGITTDLAGSEAQAAIAAQALINGVSRCVSIEATSGLDTHFNDWATNQGPRQRRGFNAIARLVEHLAEAPYGDTGESMLDRTTIVGFSEFMRTPLINDRGGRDHHLTNSCFLLGGKIKGNTAIGASSDVAMSPQKVDLASGRVDLGGEVIRPEHILRTLMVDAGIETDEADLRVEPIAALLRS
jgi:uncharacterized protein (DUF1501 family)